MAYKIGFGYDLHRLQSGRRLFLGGVEIPFAKGLAGHSDGDCLIHAVIDALLGASGEMDIGRLFPDDDPRYKDIRSLKLLEIVADRLKSGRLEIQNIDVVVVAEEPKLAGHVARMKEALCAVLGVEPDRLGIKAKTNEGLGLIGDGRAIACWAAALVKGKKAKSRVPSPADSGG